MKMPKTKKEFESYMIYAFSSGIASGYGIDHYNCFREENIARLEFAKENNFSKECIEKLNNIVGKQDFKWEWITNDEENT